ncbi:MAG: RNA methyltransferase [Balneolaceae bacterium]
MDKASGNQVKKWRKLQQRKYREKEKLFLAEGERCVTQIVENRAIEVEDIVVEDGRVPSRVLLDSGIRLSALSPEEINELSDTDHPQGILAVCRIPDEIDPSSLAGRTGVLVALDEIQDPGNFGTIIRTSVWFGASGLIAGTGCVDPWHPKVVRSTAGTTGVLPVVKGDLKSILRDLSNNGREVILLEGGRESERLADLKTLNNAVITVGNEANGIQRELLEQGWRKIGIEGRHSGVESLNAAIATGIALYHINR